MARSAFRTVEEKAAAMPICTRDALGVLERCSRPLWIYACDRKRIVWANRAGLSFWEASTLAEIGGRSVSPVSDGVAQRLENLRHRLARILRVEEQWTLYPRGMPRTVPTSASLVELETGEQGLLFEVLDHDARAVPSPDVHRTQVRAVEAINQAPLMISLMTPEGAWLMHNPAAEALIRRLGRAGEAGYLGLFADQGTAAGLCAQALEKGSGRASLRMAGRFPRFHDVTMRRVIDPATGAVAVMVSQLDVTRAKVLERRLERALEAEREMSETQRHFLSLTSHEFRTPLAIIAGATRRLRALAGDGAEVKERLDTISRAVSRMQDAMEKTLWGGRIEANRVAFHPAPLDLAGVIVRAVRVQQELHPERHINMSLDPLPEVTADAALVEQAIDNLLSNAIKYSGPEHPVEVSGRVEPDTIAVKVRDHGLGVPEKDRPRLFSRFFRASNARGIKGTGIGLMVVRHLMDLHGGSINFDSREGEGTEVTLRFPLIGQ